MFFKRRKNTKLTETKPKPFTKVVKSASMGGKRGSEVATRGFVSGELNGRAHVLEEKVGAGVQVGGRSSDKRRSAVNSSRVVAKRQEGSTRGAQKGPSEASLVSRQTFGMTDAVHRSLEFQMNPQSVVSGGYESSYNVSADRTQVSHHEEEEVRETREVLVGMLLLV